MDDARRAAPRRSAETPHWPLGGGASQSIGGTPVSHEVAPTGGAPPPILKHCVAANRVSRVTCLMNGVRVNITLSGQRMTSRAVRLVRELGWFNAFLYVIGLLLERVTVGRCGLYKYQLVAQAVAAAPLCQGRGKRIGVRLVGSADALPADYPRARAVIERRFAQGAICLAAFDGERLLGFLWLQHGAYQEDEVRARYRADAWDFDVTVSPEYRLGPAFARLWDEANALLRARGLDWSCSRISAFNPGSLAAHGRIGTVKLGSALFLRCGPLQLCLATLAPYVHLSSHPASYPEFVLDTSALLGPAFGKANQAS